MDRLTTLLHSLPQELYDHIYEQVFTAPPGRIHIRHSYRPPHLLAVSSGTRKQFAESYYQNIIFVTDGDLDLRKWLRGVQGSGHLQLLREVRFMNRSLLDPCISRLQAPLDRSHLYRRTAAQHHARHLLARLQRMLDHDKLDLSEGVFTLEQHFLADDLAEDVVLCRLSDDVRALDMPKYHRWLADILRCLHTIQLQQ